MLFVIAGLGLILAIVSLLLLLKPVASLQVARTYFVTRGFQYGLVVFSVVLAAAFYYGASETRFPQVFSVLAMLTFIGAAISLCLFPNQFRAIVEWELKLLSPYPIVIAFWYALFSAFLLYAVL